jgi:hypothetical protein
MPPRRSYEFRAVARRFRARAFPDERAPGGASELRGHYVILKLPTDRRRSSELTCRVEFEGFKQAPPVMGISAKVSVEEFPV